jgi:thiamine-monophosphate kinase
MDERARIAMLARTLAVGAAEGDAGVEVGIGDDAAVLAASHPASHLVWTIDEQVEGVHFRRELVSWRDVGWRSLMAAASDVAAMGAIPWCVLSSLVLPDDLDDAALEDIVRGQGDAAASIGAPVVGGNLARGTHPRGFSIATTLLGSCDRPVERRGARAGDGLWVAGALGLAAAGLRALEQGIVEGERFAEAVAAWRTPRALIAEGRAMGAVAHAAVDVSDGLARDAGHLGESSGVCLVLDEAALTANAALVAAATALGESPVDLALHGGEDYALLAASTVPIPGFRRIGEVREGRGLVLRGAGGERVIEAKGFDHFLPVSCS